MGHITLDGHGQLTKDILVRLTFLTRLTWLNLVPKFDDFTQRQGCEIDPPLADSDFDSDSDSDFDLTKSTSTPDQLELRLRAVTSGKHLFDQDSRPFRITEAVQSRELQKKRKSLAKMVGRSRWLTSDHFGSSGQVILLSLGRNFTWWKAIVRLSGRSRSRQNFIDSESDSVQNCRLRQLWLRIRLQFRTPAQCS